MKIKNLRDAEKLETGEGDMWPLVLGENLSFYYLEIPPQLEVPPHSHPREGILYCLEGELELISRDGKRSIGKDTALLLEPNEALGLKNLTKKTVKTLLISGSSASGSVKG